MAGSEAGDSADAVALAIRDLTEQVRVLRLALCVSVAVRFEADRDNIPYERVKELMAAFDAVRKAP